MGHARAVRREPRARTPTASSTCRSARRSTPRPTSCAARSTAAADAPGYPQTYGTPALREAVAAWFARRRGVPGVDPAAVLPTIGSKELVAWLPTLLGLGPGDVVVHPEVAYPTYDVGARLAGATPVAADGLTALGPAAGRGWCGSTRPSNPTGRVLPVEHLRKVVDWARERGAVVASDECYAELGWGSGRRRPVGAAPATCAAAGTRACWPSTRCPSGPTSRATARRSSPATRRWSRELLEVRKHAGMMVPAPVQAAMVAALGDDAHVRDAARSATPRGGSCCARRSRRAGWRVDDSEAGLYLWVTRDEDCWESVGHLARLGILVAPGAFYGPAGARHVRVALTATDERVACGRCSGSAST